MSAHSSIPLSRPRKWLRAKPCGTIAVTRLRAIMSDFIDAEGFRANVGIVLTSDDRRVFLGGRTGGRGWQFPQGGVLRNEAPEQALYRELKEEIGLEESDVELIAATRHWLRYRLPPQYVRRNSQPQCIGQKQRWFMLRLTGSEDRLHFDSTNAPE